MLLGHLRPSIRIGILQYEETSLFTVTEFIFKCLHFIGPLLNHFTVYV